MNEPRLRYVTCPDPRGLHRMAYWEWGAGNEGPPVVCVHGLTRNGRDFDAIAQRLAQRFHVVCPDMIGRGRSDRVADPALYVVPQYISDCVTLVARLDTDKVHWVGTSMGGLIGMSMAALPGNAIASLVLNDIGPAIDPEGLARIADYVGQDPRFESFEEGERALRALMVDFGPHTDEQFRLLSRHFVVRRGDDWGYHYDPAIAIPFRSAPPATDLWPFYDAISAPTLLLRGAQSDVLAEDVAAQMQSRGPAAQRVDFEGVGHAPTLIADDQIETVERFLLEQSQ
ncbi:MAG: alpha/beta hydrolase [Burkholderiaceae bacterium]